MKTTKHLLATLALLTACQALGGEFEDLLTMANEGDAVAQYTVGQKYSKGDGVSKNIGNAVKWLEESAMQGNADAQLSLGRLFIGGRGVPRDSTEAAKWFQLAAEQRRPSAQVQMARMHLAGTGVPQDDVQAAKWATLALAQGENQASPVLVFLHKRMTAAQTAEAKQLASEFLVRKSAADAAKGIPSVAPPLE